MSRLPFESCRERGRDLGPTDGFEIDQARVDESTDTAQDTHWIHDEPELASRGTGCISSPQRYAAAWRRGASDS